MAIPTGTMTSREDKSPNSSKQPTRTSLQIWMEELPWPSDEKVEQMTEKARLRNKERAEKAKKQMPR